MSRSVSNEGMPKRRAYDLVAANPRRISQGNIRARTPPRFDTPQPRHRAWPGRIARYVAGVFQARPPGFLADGQPDLKRRLGSEVVKTQYGEQADPAFGCSFADLGQRVVLGGVTLRQDIEFPADPHCNAGLKQKDGEKKSNNSACSV